MIRHIKKLVRGESGSAMTEFVIGLPIFIIIFSGMGTLYRMNQESLIVKADANAKMWKGAEASMIGMIPLVGAATSVNSIGDLFQNGLSGGGIYLDSGIKVKIPYHIMPGAVAVNPQLTVGAAMQADDKYISHNLLNDMVNPTWHGGGFVGAFNSIVQTTGAGPAIAAGMRYGSVDGEATRSFNTRWGSMSFESGKLDIPMPNASVHRVAPVIMARLGMEQDVRYKEPIPVFNTDGNLEDSDREEINECTAQANDYQACKDAGNLFCDKPDSSCREMGSNPFGSIDIGWCAGMPGCSKPSY